MSDVDERVTRLLVECLGRRLRRNHPEQYQAWVVPETGVFQPPLEAVRAEAIYQQAEIDHPFSEDEDDEA